MIHGYEEASIIPAIDLYDTGMMNTYLSAVQREYERGLAEQLAFATKYGDFESVFSNDVDYYNNNTLGRVLSAMKLLSDAGIDPIRSSEGRAVMSQVMRDIPYAELAKIRQSAKIGDAYVKARGLLAALGKWNPEYEKFLLNGKSFEDWDTTKDGAWTRMSPDEYSDLNTSTTKWFDLLSPSFIKTENGYDWFGISDSDLNRSLLQNIPDFVNSNIGRYNYELAKNQLTSAGVQNPTYDQVVDRLKLNIIAANREKLNLTPKVNEYAQMKQQHDYKVQDAYLEFELAKKLKDYDLAKDIEKAQLLNNGGGQGYGGNVQYSTKTEIDVLNKDANGDGTREGYNNIGHVINGAINYWNNAIKTTKNNASKNKDAKWHANWWKNVMNSLNNAKSEKEAYGILLKNKLIDENGNVTNVIKNAHNYINSESLYGDDKAKPTDYKMKQRYSNSFNRYAVDNVGEASNKTNDIAFTKNAPAQIVSFKDGYTTKDKRRLIDLQDGTYSYAPVRHIQAVSNRSYMSNSITKRFDNWLKSDKLITALNGTKYGGVKLHRVPSKQGYTFDFAGQVEISEDDITRFAKSQNLSTEYVVNKLGLKPTQETIVTKNTDDNSAKQLSKTFYYVPVVKTNNPSITYIDEINNTYNKYNYGGGNAYKMMNNALNAAGGEVR